MLTTFAPRALSLLALACYASTASAQTQTQNWPLSAIYLSKARWGTEDADPKFFVWPSSLSNLPTCTFSNPQVLSYSTSTPPTPAAAVVTINAKEARKLPSGNNTLTVNCGGKTADIVINNTYPTLTKAAGRLDDSDRSAVKLIVTRPPAEVSSSSAPINYWIAAVVPGSVFGVPNDQIFFLKKNSDGSPQWAQLSSEDFRTVAFATDMSAAEPSHEFPVNFGFSKDDLAGIRAVIYFGYQIGNDQIKLLDTIWNPVIDTPISGKYADPERLYAFETINQIRGIVGRKFAAQSEAIDKGAQAHAEYTMINWGDNSDLHAETPGRPGFTGVMPTDRAKYFGYDGNLVGEGMVVGGSNMLNVWRLMGKPYHAIGQLLLNQELGIGSQAQSVTVFNPGWKQVQVDTSAAGIDSVIIYPCNNIKVNVQGQGYETPNPQILNGKQDFGYSTVAVATGMLRVNSWKLYDSYGNIIPTLTTTGEDDPRMLANGGTVMAMIPIDALPRIETNYTSVLNGTIDGIAFEKTCKWRSVAGDKVPHN